MDNNFPLISFNVSPRDPLQEFYNHNHDENGRFTSGEAGGKEYSQKEIDAINKRGHSLARKYHKGQKDLQGRDYVDVHLTQVSSKLPPRLKLAGWLHDSLEDTNATPESLRRDGVDENTIRIVKALTSPSGEPKEKQLARVINGGIDAIRVKIADTSTNYEHSKTLPPDMLHPKYGDPLRERLIKKYEPSLKQLKDALAELEKKQRR